MKTPTKCLLLFSIFLLLSGCKNTNKTANEPKCGVPLSDQNFDDAIKHLNYKMPDRWTKVHYDSYYSSGSSLFTIAIFDPTDSNLEGCLDLFLSSNSFDVTILDSSVNKLNDPIFDSGPIHISVSGITKEKKVPYKGEIFGFTSHNHIYILLWDAYGEKEISRIEDDIIFTIGSIQVVNSP
jgi:hypothetical protein